MLYNIFDHRIYHNLDYMDRMIAQFLSNSKISKHVFQPKVNLFKNQDKVKIKASVPGFSRDSLDILLEENEAIISGYRSSVDAAETQAKSPENLQFRRIVRLPFEVNKESLGANLINGVLTIDLEKEPKKSARKIAIQVNNDAS